MTAIGSTGSGFSACDGAVVVGRPIAGMEFRRREIRGADYLVASAGSGPPLLRLCFVGRQIGPLARACRRLS
jgi:hypothetical protein